jgi:hypothetical protein
LVVKFIGQPLSRDIMHVIESQQIDAPVKWISQILVNIGTYKHLFPHQNITLKQPGIIALGFYCCRTASSQRPYE